MQPSIRPNMQGAGSRTVSSTRARVLTLHRSADAPLERAAEAFWMTVILSVLLLAFAVAGFAGPLVQTSAKDLLLAPLQAVEQGWDLLRRIDWSYGLRRSF